MTKTLFHVSLHDEAGLEHDHFLGRYGNFLTGAGISSQTAAAGLNLEDSKITQFNGLTRCQILRNFI